MNIHMVIFDYDPGKPAIYVVRGAPDELAAAQAALRKNGYHPGVRIQAYRCENFVPVVLPEYVVDWRPLTREEEFLIRYND
jgi:hypothetical protein